MLNIHTQSVINNTVANSPLPTHVDTLAAKPLVEKCVKGWSSRNSNGLKDLVYKIVEFFKSLVFCSDWQLAKKAMLKATVTNLGLNADLIPVNILKSFNKINEQVLKLLVKINNLDYDTSISPFNNVDIFISKGKIGNSIDALGVDFTMLKASFTKKQH